MPMTPTEAEVQAAVDAAARDLFDRDTAPLRARVAEDPDAVTGSVPMWEELDPMARHRYLDMVQPVVWAALQALPDRLDQVRLMLLDDPDPIRFQGDMKRMLTQ
jgi:hypothetical protein